MSNKPYFFTNPFYLYLLFSISVLPIAGFSQINEAYDDFEGNSNIPLWYGDNCNINTNFANPFVQGNNLSTTVLSYEDVGGQYANVHFQMNDNFDLSINQTFSLQIYVPSNGITGSQPNQVSLKLQDGTLTEPWITQSEIIKPITLDQWQTVTFNFDNDNYINLDPSSIAPTLRTDFNRVIIQVNGENNTDQVLAYIDDILLYDTPFPVDEAFDDFDGNTNIPMWYGDFCTIDTTFTNPFSQGSNPSATVLRYEDTGDLYANARFQMNDNFDLSTNQTFSLQIYVPSNGITGSQPNQVSLKLQDGTLTEPWITQSEIIKPITLDQWQTVTFNFENDNYINLNPSSIAPTLRTDFNRVVIQVNGENNTDQVLAYIDDILLYQESESIFDALVWSDEFDTNGAVDPCKWHHQTLFPNPQLGSWFNGEIQHYTDRIDNSYVDNGVLKIVAKKETFTDQGVTKQYTSARLNSKFAFTYGKVEIRAKLPFGVGTWPALWMLGKNITENGAYWETQGYGTTGWPDCGEIDIMEHWGNNQNYVSSAIHTPSSSGNTVNVAGQSISNASSQFHIYTMVWTEESIVFSVDGITHYTYNPSNKNDSTWPFYEDQFILFNVALLSNIDPNYTESAMEIDYIRIYQDSEIADLSATEDCIQIYPNYVSNQFTITGDLQLYQIEILDSTEQVYQTINPSGTSHTIDTSTLPVGLYFVRVKNLTNNLLEVQKIIKR